MWFFTVALMGVLCCASAWSQGAPPGTLARNGAVGTFHLKDVPQTFYAPEGAGFFWRFKPASVDAAPSADFLNQFLVILTQDKNPGNMKEGRITMKGYRAEPLSMVVNQGSLLFFKGEGPVSYTMEVEGREMPPTKVPEDGAEVEVALKKSGRYLFKDTVYASARSYVIVAPAVASSGLHGVARDEARFDFGKIAPGTYTLSVYFRGNLVENMTREVEVTSSGALTPSNFLVTGSDL